MSEMVIRLTVPSGAGGSRLDTFLASEIKEHTRSALRRMIAEGRVRVDGKAAAKPGLSLRDGGSVEVALPEAAPEGPVPEDIPFEVVHEDDHLVIVSKPAGLVVHAGHGRRSGTLVNALLGRGIPLAPAGGAERPGIVHRLDADTSGLIVVAKTDAALRSLQRAFAERRVVKRYQALVWGRPDPAAGRIERPVGRSRPDPTRMSVRSPRGRAAATEYVTVETIPGFAMLRVRIETGRTHQIRVHLQSIHHPVVGDARYGGQQFRGVQDPLKRKALREFRRLALHSSELSFPHPATGVEARFESPLPDDFASLLRVLREAR